MGHEGILAGGEAGDLHIIVARDEEGGVGVLVEEGDHLSEVGEALGVQLAAVHEHVKVSGVVTGKAGVEVLAEQVLRGGPVKLGGVGAVADDSGDAQLVLHGVDLLKGGLHGLGAGDAGGINAGFVKDALVVGKADRLSGVGEADESAGLINKAGIGIGGPGLVGHIDHHASPVVEVGFAFANEDIGHVAGLIVLLQRGLQVNAAAERLDLDMLAGRFLVDLGSMLQGLRDLDLAVEEADAVGERGRGQQCDEHRQHQEDCQILFHSVYLTSKKFVVAGVPACLIDSNILRA